MFDIDRWQEIFASIKSNKLRTFLSGITIALALFIFITLFGLSKGLQNGFAEEFFPPNVKTIYISGGQTTLPYKGKKSGRKISLKNKDYKLLEKNLKDKIDIIVPNLYLPTTARYLSESGTYALTGTTSNQQAVSKFSSIEGRFLDIYDNTDLEKNVVIGRLVKKDLFKNESAIGKHIQLGNTMYKVVGVFSDENGDDSERKIFVPYKTLQIIYGTDHITNIKIVPKKSSSLDEISSIATLSNNLLKNVHDVNPDDTRGIKVEDPKKGLETTQLFFFIFTIIVFVIGIGSLIAGIVSITNMMVFSVKERTKEIGIRKALGAKPSNIIGLILQETMVITLVFGFTGIFVAMVLTYYIKDKFIDYLIYNPSVENSSIIMAAIILFLSGFIAGFIPARKAAKIKPIEALNVN